MLLGETGDQPAERPTIRLSSQLKIRSTFHAAFLNFLVPIVEGRVSTEPILQVAGTHAEQCVASIRQVSFHGGGIEFLNMCDVQVLDVLIRHATTAIKASFVDSLTIRRSDFSRTATIDKCVVAFSTKKCELIRIMDQRIIGAGMIFLMGECRTCEVCNLTARDCGSMGKITARNPVALTGCSIEAKLPNLATGLAGKLLSVCSDRVLISSSRGRIPPLQNLTDPLVTVYAAPLPRAPTPEEPAPEAPTPEAPTPEAPTTEAPPPEAPTTEEPFENPHTPPQWFDDMTGWDAPPLLFTPLNSPFASPVRAVSKMTPEKRPRV